MTKHIATLTPVKLTQQEQAVADARQALQDADREWAARQVRVEVLQAQLADAMAAANQAAAVRDAVRDRLAAERELARGASV